MNKRNVATFCNTNFQRQYQYRYVPLKKRGYVLYMYIVRFTQFFQPTKNSKNLTLFVSSECELKPWFPIPLEDVSKPCQCVLPQIFVLVWAMRKPDTSVFVVRIHHTTDHITHTALGHSPYICRTHRLSSATACGGMAVVSVPLIKEHPWSLLHNSIWTSYCAFEI